MTQFRWTYVWTYLLAVVLLAGLSYALELFTALDAPTGLSTVLPPMLAASQVGTRYAMAHAALPSKADAWRAAGWMTAVALVINLVIAGLWLLLPETRALLAASPGLLAGVFLALMGLVYLANRWAIMIGAKAGLRAVQKRGDG